MTCFKKKTLEMYNVDLLLMIKIHTIKFFEECSKCSEE